MKKSLARLMQHFPKRSIASSIVTLAVVLPVIASAAQTVPLTSSTNVANTSSKDMTFHPSIKASLGQQVEVEVGYKNIAPATSGKIAKNLRVKINLPSEPGSTQTIITTVSADNSTPVKSSAKISLDHANEFLTYNANGAKQWRWNAKSKQWVPQKISDSVVTGGVVLGDKNPGENGFVTIYATVQAANAGSKLTMQSEPAGQTNTWSASNTAQPGDTMKYRLTFQNSGNTTENNVIVRDNLPSGETLVPNTTVIFIGQAAKGAPDTSNKLATGGINIGDFKPETTAVVEFQAKIADTHSLACGDVIIKNIGSAQPQGVKVTSGTATTKVRNDCVSQPGKPGQPTCTVFQITPGDNRTAIVSNFTADTPNGATFTNAVIDWGDKTSSTFTAVQNQRHPYANDGTYPVTAVAHFSVQGRGVTANCPAQTVTITTPTTPAKPTTTPPTIVTAAAGKGESLPSQLVNTGAGNVIGLFIGAAAIGFAGYRLFLKRRLARR